jgi:hypothetical protein
MTANTPDGWHIGVHNAHYLTRSGNVVAVVHSRPIGWTWWDFRSGTDNDGFVTIEAAKRAAEEGTCKT